MALVHKFFRIQVGFKHQSRAQSQSYAYHARQDRVINHVFLPVVVVPCCEALVEAMDIELLSMREVLSGVFGARFGCTCLTLHCSL